MEHINEIIENGIHINLTPNLKKYVYPDPNSVFYRFKLEAYEKFDLKLHQTEKLIEKIEETKGQ